MRSAEVSVGEDHGGHQGPDVQGQANPAGGDLHPHHWPLAADGVVCVGAVSSRAHSSTFIHSGHLKGEFTHLPHLAPMLMEAPVTFSGFSWRELMH